MTVTEWDRRTFGSTVLGRFLLSYASMVSSINAVLWHDVVGMTAVLTLKEKAGG